jgi:hypothetical protein
MGEYQFEGSDLGPFAGNLLLTLFPGVWHRYRPLGQGPWTERTLSFCGRAAYQLLDFGRPNSPYHIADESVLSALISEFDGLLKILQMHSQPSSELLALMTLRTLVEVAIVARTLPRDTTTNWIAALNNGVFSERAENHISNFTWFDPEFSTLIKETA